MQSKMNAGAIILEEFTPGATLYHGKSPAKGGVWGGKGEACPSPLRTKANKRSTG